MASNSIGQANLKLVADASGLLRTVDSVQSRLLTFGKTVGTGLIGGLGGTGELGILASSLAGGNLAGGIAAAVRGAQQLTQAFIETGKAADELADDAAALGASTEGLFGLRAAALDNVEELNKALMKLQVNIGKAMEGDPEAGKKFEKLGLAAKDLAAVSADEAFIRMAEAIERLPTAAQKSAAAVELFGKAGQKNMEIIARARDLSTVFSKLGVAVGAVPSDNLADSFDRMQIAAKGMEIVWGGIKNKAAGVVSDVITTQAIFATLAASKLGIGFGAGGGEDSAKKAADSARELAELQKRQKAEEVFDRELRKREQREMMEDNKAMIQMEKDVQTPMERRAEEMDKMKDLFERRAITEDLFRRGLQKQASELEKEAMGVRGPAGAPFAGVSVMGSKEAADAFNREFALQQQKGPEQEILDLLRDKLNLPTPELWERIRSGMKAQEKLANEIQTGKGI